jgi:hypothetical protein
MKFNFLGYQISINKQYNKKDFHYQFRNFPCTVGDWYVGGNYYDENGNGGAGVLEWCESKEDAENLLKIMKKDKRFMHLKVYNR